jgi:hypothetical protein
MITQRTPRSLTITMDAFGVDGFAVRLKIRFFSGVSNGK